MNIEQVFADAKTDELLINGASVAWVYGRGTRYAIDRPFSDQASALRWIQDLARRSGTRLDPLYPANGGMLEGGRFRWHCVLPPVAEHGPIISIRRHRFADLTLKDFSLSCDIAVQLRETIAAKQPMLVCGATGSGKTTFLAALMHEFMCDERLMILEHLPELPRLGSQWVRLTERAPNVEGVGGVTIERLFEEALRLRPDRFVIGEIRGREAPIYLKSLLSGHVGSLATMHAGSARAAWTRLVSLCADKEEASESLRTSCVVAVMLENRRVVEIEEIRGQLT